MTNLDLPAASVSGLIAWWSLIHVSDEAMPAVLGHFHRVLRPGARVAEWLRDAEFTVESQWELNMDTDRPGAVLFARR